MADKLTVSVRVFHICGPHFFMWRVEYTVELSLQYICNVKKKREGKDVSKNFPMEEEEFLLAKMWKHADLGRGKVRSSVFNMLYLREHITHFYHMAS